MFFEVDEWDVLRVWSRKWEIGEQVHEDGPLDIAEQLKNYCKIIIGLYVSLFMCISLCQSKVLSLKSTMIINVL